MKYKFSVGDQVRINKARRTFKKGYLPSWTEEVFTITKRIRRKPPVYKIADYHGNELEGTFMNKNCRKLSRQTVTIIESKKQLNHACVINKKKFCEMVRLS